MKKTNIIIILIFSIIILLFFYNIKKIKIDNLQEDLIFFKIFNNQENKENQKNEEMINRNEIEYKFEVSYKNIKFQKVNFSETINQKTLVREKIAPGTNGNFSIILNSNEILKYKIIFESKNKKPKNLKFSMEGSEKEYNSLEELSKILTGVIMPKKEKIININWKWQYNTNYISDLIDTKDGENINKYEFYIYVVGNK